MKLSVFALLLTFLIMLSGCASSETHRNELASTQERQELKKESQKITKGMSQNEVKNILGNPDMVTNGKDGEESWVYSKMATEVSLSKDSGGAGFLLIGGGSSAGAEHSTNKTLTVIITFDSNKKVISYKYNENQF